MPANKPVLKTYRAKRNFKQTPEPKGGKGRAGVRHFVVQEHHASHLHYDFRLEWGGALKSWAVPKGPPRHFKEHRLAVMVEDHPLAYRTFHGVIPKGNYGAGTVKIWDEGTYTVSSGTSTKDIEAAMEAGFKKGDVTFELHGKKMKGVYALIRMDSPKFKNGWLFMKKHERKPVVDFRPETGKRAPMPHDVAPMLAEMADKPFSREGWIFEMKWDGYRALAEVSKGGVALYSRSGQSFNQKFSPVVEDLKTVNVDAVFDGEVVALDAKGKPAFELLQEYQKTGKGRLVYEVFDLLYLDGRDLRGLPLLERKRLLKSILPNLSHVKYTDHVEKNGVALFTAAKRNGLEGVMAKDGQSTYQTGKRSGDWLKMKNVMEQEAVIAGYTEPRRGRKYLGAVILGVYRGGEFVYIGHTGGGSNDAMLRELKTKLSKLEQRSSPFALPPKPNAPVHWVKPTLVCEVKFQEWTSDGVMRQPIFLGLREDKSAHDVVKEEPRNAAKQPFEFTHAEKVFWPKEKITKGDVLAYYHGVAKYILPYLKDRPESLNRFPGGIEEEHFFQKDMPNAPEWARTVKLHSESENKTINYLVCDDEQTLRYMVQLGCIEINPWNSRIKTISKPDYMIMDLDPEGVPFSAVVKTALAVKEVLDELGAKGYCKTSGGRGLHIYVPLAAKYSYEQARLFSQLVAQFVHEKVPELTSLERNPKKRTHAVYLDSPQNKEGATTVAAYCIRPRPGAMVSTPLRWNEVKIGLDPTKFTIKNTAQRLKKVGDLWKPVLGKGIDLKKCLDRAERKRNEL
ncbi:MAG: DNA ligase D [Patescibacteria group bacterium]